jgi:hypothetical protein
MNGKKAIVTASVLLLLGSTLVNPDMVLDCNKVIVANMRGQNAFAQARFAVVT